MVVGFLIVAFAFDVCIGRAFPTSGLGTLNDRTGLRRYFEHGRSVEGKIRRMLGNGMDQHPLLTAGWFESQYPSIAATGRTMTVYGMSFAMNAADTAGEFLDGYEVRGIGAPAAPLSHSYAALERDPHWQDSAVIVLGILASSLPRIQSLTHMTGSWEAPCPHTYPRYMLEGSMLRSIQPSVGSLQQLLGTLEDGRKWTMFTDQLREFDSYFDAFVFHSTFDESVIVRLLRRGWGQNRTRAVDASAHSAAGFREDLAELGRAVLAAFIRKVRSGGRPVVIVLFNDRGFSDHLHDTLAKTLEDEGVPYVSTHRIAPAEDLGNFVSDGHFTATVNREIGRQLADTIRTAVGR